ncbi:hypothetical protein QK360_11330 [Pseudomonas aeruginosa]|uniref:hypothetical protein n=1 Tax=Pseudomonas aeruginosa TaxID=287 RepID=UPI000A07FCE7|nr:hypothetical protein [Pseudomonas aeruginosa]ARI05608.1 hypothetical protein Y880_0589002 [Pseudomonas aeruginosa PAK]MBG4227195.1 hypothetical protein [Pseudomonas aeruginosa]MBG4238879.1 hypothetical protein [Pseudomonas aeruginosa]MBH3596985.1 hypothetical protein [Pseudomonas aeruginosa]MBH4220523.1 hypothetical protein [Pseudomonas aeruginosa]
MSLLTAIANILTIRREIPPVHYSYIEPFAHNLPKEISDITMSEGEDYFITSFVGIENFSGFVLKNIRIKIKSPLKYSPLLRSSIPSETIEHIFDKNKNEIIIETLDPGQSVYLDLYPEPAALAKDFEPDVIINDQLLTRAMRSYGYYKKYPKHAGLELLFYTFLIGAAAFLYHVWNSANMSSLINGDRALVDAAAERLGSGCHLRAVEMSHKAQEIIFRSPEAAEFAMTLNSANSLNDLLKLKKIVLCVSDEYADPPK